MIRHLVLIFIFAIVACGKPDLAKHDSAIPEAPAARLSPPPKAAMDEADQISSLIDPEKLATLKERGANPRIQKITAILWIAKTQGKNPEEITLAAVKTIGWGGSLKGELTAAAILRNLDIAEKLGATTPEDIAAMKRGNAATVRKGSYIGDILSVDHVIPRAVVPELDNVICNLELMPLRLNQSKGDAIGDRQRDLARKLYAAGLLAKPELSE
jgi:hypothetical protein